MGNRTPLVPQVTQDVNFNNNVATVTGIEGQQIQNPNTPSGVFFVDSTNQFVQCLPLGGDLSGTPDNAQLTPSGNTLATILNKLIWNVDGTLVYDNDNTLTLEV